MLRSIMVTEFYLRQFSYFYGRLLALRLWLALQVALFSYLVGLFASIFRYERIAMVLRGTRRYKILLFIRITSTILPILSSLNYMLMDYTSIMYYYSWRMLFEVSAAVYLVINGLTAAWFIIVDLALGIRMTTLVIDSVRKDKISETLRPRLLSTLGLIILIDLVIVLFVVWVRIFEFGVFALMFGMLHTLVSLQLLVVLQQGVKAKPRDNTFDESSSGRVISGVESSSVVDSALVASHDSRVESKS